MLSASSPSLNMEGLATMNFEILHENENNNNIQLYDMANRENGFWSQPEEELFYTPQPLFSLVPQLPFANTVYIDGDHYLPADADLLFGEIDSDDDESLEPVWIETDQTPVVTETVDDTLSGIERVNDTPFVTETVNDTPVQIISVDETPVQIETEIDTQLVVETVNETGMFADRTSSLEPDATEKPAMIETVNDTDTFADQSRTSSFGPDTTEVYPPNADLNPDSLWDSAVRSPSRISLILQASDITDDVLEATRDAVRAACEGDSSTVEGACFLDRVLQVTRDILLATYETESDGTRSVMEEVLNYIRGYEILRDTVIQIISESNTMADELKDFVARFEELCQLPFCYSSSDQSLFQPARLESDAEPHGSAAVVSVSSSHNYVLEVLEETDNDPRNGNNTAISPRIGTSNITMGEEDGTDSFDPWLEEELNPIWGEIIDDARSLEHWESRALPEDWTTHDREGRVDQSVFEAHNAWNNDTSLVYNNTDVINRWLCQNYGQGEYDLTLSNHYSFYDNEVSVLATEPRFSQSAVDTCSANRKRKLEETDEEILESKSDTFLMSQQITGAKRRRLYPDDPEKCDVPNFYDYSYNHNNEEFVIRGTQSAADMHAASRKRKMEEMEDTLLESRSDSFLISREIKRAKRSRI